VKLTHPFEIFLSVRLALPTVKKIYAATPEKCCLALLLVALAVQAAQAQKVRLSRKIKGEEFDIVRESLLLPHPRKLHAVKAAIIIQKFKFPEPWLEGDYHVPFINAQATMGLKRNFSAEFRVGTIIVSNQVNVGLRWHHRFDENLFFSVGYDMAAVYGAIGQTSQLGYDNRVHAIIHCPNLSLGYRYKDMAFTLRGEVNVVGHVKIRAGENVISDSRNFYNGFSIGLFIEQRLWKNNVVIMGLRDNYQKFSYIAWPAFSTFNRFYHIPEISIGLVL
jgi:hypothetical protein